MDEGAGRIVELTLIPPDGGGDEVMGLVNLANVTHVRPIRNGDATLTRIAFLDGSHVDVTEPLAEVARLAGVPTRRPQRRFWGTPANRPGVARALPLGPTCPPDHGRRDCTEPGVEAGRWPLRNEV